MDPKRAILGRRARFLIAAIAGVGPACHKEEKAREEPDVALIAPEPCLTVVPPPPPVPDAGSEAASPRPCLTIVPRHTSQPKPIDPNKF